MHQWKPHKSRTWCTHLHVKVKITCTCLYLPWARIFISYADNYILRQRGSTNNIWFFLFKSITTSIGIDIVGIIMFCFSSIFYYQAWIGFLELILVGILNSEVFNFDLATFTILKNIIWIKTENSKLKLVS